MNYTDFLEEIRQTKSVNTFKTYQRALGFFPEGTRQEAINVISSGLADTTKRLYLQVFRSALEWYGVNDRDITRVIKGYRAEEKVEPCPTPANVELLWKGLSKPRDKAIFALMCYNGLRVGEIASIKMQDVSDDAILIRHTKGKQDAVIPLVHGRVRDALQSYIKVRQKTAGSGLSDVLFLTEGGKPLGIRDIQRFIQNECTMNGLDFHCHSFRRFFANTLKKAGVPIEDIQQCLRHKTITTTMKYLNFGEGTVKNTLAAVYG